MIVSWVFIIIIIWSFLVFGCSYDGFVHLMAKRQKVGQQLYMKENDHDKWYQCTSPFHAHQPFINLGVLIALRYILYYINQMSIWCQNWILDHLVTFFAFSVFRDWPTCSSVIRDSPQCDQGLTTVWSGTHHSVIRDSPRPQEST